MLTNRTYRPARPTHEALTELHNQAGSRLCPRCVTALETLFPLDTTVEELSSDRHRTLVVAG